jgi:hypothetical protein
MTPTTTTTSASFTGWHRPHTGAPWRRVCSAPTADAAWEALFAAGLDGDKLVSHGDDDPNDRLADRRRRRF